MIKIISNKKGFSLIELMVVVVILGLMVLGLVTFFTGGVRSWISGQSQLEAQRNARQAMDSMVREIREGDSIDESSTNSYIKFYTPFGPSSGYSYSYNESNREIKEGTVSLIQNVKECTFTYYDKNKVLINPPESDKVSIVKINLEVDVDADGNPDITLNTNVNLRNYVVVVEDVE